MRLTIINGVKGLAGFSLKTTKRNTSVMHYLMKGATQVMAKQGNPGTAHKDHFDMLDQLDQITNSKQLAL